MTRSLLSLTAHLIRLRPRAALFGLAGMFATALLAMSSCPNARVEVATFNIRDFPESEAQVGGAFAAITELEVPLVAVEEITDPQLFNQAARRYLGPTWRAEFGPSHTAGRDRRRVGLLYDSAHYTATKARLHPLPGRPALEVQLKPAGRGSPLRVFVVHLKSGGDFIERRAKQLRALTAVVQQAVTGDDRIIVLGDFNSTSQTDRKNLASFATSTGLIWASEDLACTAYWKPGGRCTSSALDHVFTSRSPATATARGPCETEGCNPGESCPVFFDVVSDHCPITASF